jgi:hypothetical protein
MVEAPASKVMKRNRMSDVLLKRIWVKMIEQTKKPGK